MPTAVKLGDAEHLGYTVVNEAEIVAEKSDGHVCAYARSGSYTWCLYTLESDTPGRALVCVRLADSNQSQRCVASAKFFIRELHRSGGKVVSSTAIFDVQLGGKIEWRPTVAEDAVSQVGVRILEFTKFPDLYDFERPQRYLEGLPPVDVHFSILNDCEDYVEDSLIEKTMGAHKMYLSMVSSHFRMMFGGEYCDLSDDGTIQLEGIRAGHFRDFLAAIYPSETTPVINEDNVLELLALADRFLVDSLIEQCLLYVRFCERIPLIDRLLLAEKHKAKAGLMTYLLQWLSHDDVNAISADPKVGQLSEVTLQLMRSSLHKL